jgi:hypothetical protein
MNYHTQTETETDDVDVTMMIAKQRLANEAVKKSGCDGGKGGKFWSIFKRLTTGFFVASWFVTGMYMGQIY